MNPKYASNPFKKTRFGGESESSGVDKKPWVDWKKTPLSQSRGGKSKEDAIDIESDEAQSTASGYPEELDTAMDALSDALELIIEIKMRQYLNPNK